jgi:class III poly(R)-hydroxyalkanoic acid synthase PhaE subunit
MTTTAWTEMANQVVNTWTETGTKMWKSWFDVMGAIPTPNPMIENQSELKDVAQRFLNNRDLLVHFLKLSVEAWQDIFPKIESGDDWQNVLKKYTEQMQNQLNTFASSYLNVSKNSAQLWQLYLEETQKFSQLWIDPLGLSMGNMSKAISGNSSALIELNNFYWNLLYEETFGSLMRTPLLGPTREFNGKLLSGFEAWTNLYKSSIDYQLVLGDIQVKSFEALMKELITKAEKGEKIDDWKQFQALWSQVADDVFEQAFCEEHNLKIRGEFLNNLNKYRIQQQELMEVYLNLMNLPSRKEIDEVHRTIYELKKEVKSLRKQLAKYEENQIETASKSKKNSDTSAGTTVTE